MAHSKPETLPSFKGMTPCRLKDDCDLLTGGFTAVDDGFCCRHPHPPSIFNVMFAAQKGQAAVFGCIHTMRRVL
jgi:hypothetical protein